MPVPVTLAEQIVAKFATILEGAAIQVSDDVQRGRIDPLEMTEEPYSASVFQGSEQPIGPNAGRETNGLTNEMLTVRVDVGVNDPAVKQPTLETKLNEVCSEVYTVIMADRTLGGLAIDCIWAGCDEPQIEGKGNRPRAVMTMNWGVQYRHLTSDRRLAAP